MVFDAEPPWDACNEPNTQPGIEKQAVAQGEYENQSENPELPLVWHGESWCSVVEQYVGQKAHEKGERYAGDKGCA